MTELTREEFKTDPVFYKGQSKTKQPEGGKTT